MTIKKRSSGWPVHFKNRLVNTKTDGQREILVVRLNATLLDYVTDDQTGALLEGSKTERRNRTYRLEFIRTAGVLTDTSVDLTSHECPCCGAPVEVNATDIVLIAEM